MFASFTGLSQIGQATIESTYAKVCEEKYASTRKVPGKTRAKQTDDVASALAGMRLGYDHANYTLL